MQQILPLALIGLGSVAVVALRDARLLVGALAIQWGGMVLLVLALVPDGRPGWAELATGLVCALLLGWTVRGLHNIQVEDLPGFGESHRETWLLRQEGRAWQSRQGNLTDLALLLVTALAGGVAGFGLARLYSLGGSADASLAFYWILLSAALSLVLHGARDVLKLGVGLLLLINAAALVVETMDQGGLSALTLGLLGICRIGLVVLISYLLVVLKVRHLDADLDDIFELRITNYELRIITEPPGLLLSSPGDPYNDQDLSGSGNAHYEPEGRAEEIVEEGASSSDQVGEAQEEDSIETDESAGENMGESPGVTSRG